MRRLIFVLTDSLALFVSNLGWMMLVWAPIAGLIAFLIEYRKIIHGGVWLETGTYAGIVIVMSVLGLLVRWLGYGLFIKSPWRSILLSIFLLLYFALMVFGIFVEDSSGSGQSNTSEEVLFAIAALVGFFLIIVGVILMRGRRGETQL